ncbi:hypothetical protein RJ639_008262, partial [Escallonia herrerae]
IKEKKVATSKAALTWTILPTACFNFADAEQLRHICRISGVRVSIDTSNARDSIYRASVDYILSICSRHGYLVHLNDLATATYYSCSPCILVLQSPPFFVCLFCSVMKQSAFAQIDGEDPREFIAGLADNIGLESIRAARMVAAAVAARTRSWLLQAWELRSCLEEFETILAERPSSVEAMLEATHSWALEMQGQHAEAVQELSKICRIHHAFPPGENSLHLKMKEVQEDLAKFSTKRVEDKKITGRFAHMATLHLRARNDLMGTASQQVARFLGGLQLAVEDNSSPTCFTLNDAINLASKPEMEMVARGLEKNLKLEQREHLMNILTEICGEECHRGLAEALGLILWPEVVGDQQVNNYT